MLFPVYVSRQLGVTAVQCAVHPDCSVRLLCGKSLMVWLLQTVSFLPFATLTGALHTASRDPDVLLVAIVKGQRLRQSLIARIPVRGTRLTAESWSCPDNVSPL